MGTHSAVCFLHINCDLEYSRSPQAVKYLLSPVLRCDDNELVIITIALCICQ